MDTIATRSGGQIFSCNYNFNNRNLCTARIASGAGSSWTGLTYDNTTG